MRKADPKERRLRRRFPIQVSLRCRLPETGEVLDGTTDDISSLGVRFRSAHNLRIGQRVELRLFWPFRLEDIHPLQLFIEGSVIRSDELGTAIVSNRHEFRLSRLPLRLVTVP